MVERDIERIFNDWNGSEKEFKEKKRILLKMYHPDNGGDEKSCDRIIKLQMKDVDFFEYADVERTIICGLKRSINRERLIIPEGVKEICANAFWHKERGPYVNGPRFDVSTVILPKSLEVIGRNAFRNARSLGEVVFEHEPQQVVRIYKGAFSNNTALVMFDFRCRLEMEGSWYTYEYEYAIFDKCVFWGVWDLPFDLERVTTFGTMGSHDIDRIWRERDRKFAEACRECSKKNGSFNY